MTRSPSSRARLFWNTWLTRHRALVTGLLLANIATAIARNLIAVVTCFASIPHAITAELVTRRARCRADVTILHLACGTAAIPGVIVSVVAFLVLRTTVDLDRAIATHDCHTSRVVVWSWDQRR